MLLSVLNEKGETHFVLFYSLLAIVVITVGASEEEFLSYPPATFACAIVLPSVSKCVLSPMRRGLLQDSLPCLFSRRMLSE